MIQLLHYQWQSHSCSCYLGFSRGKMQRQERGKLENHLPKIYMDSNPLPKVHASLKPSLKSRIKVELITGISRVDFKGLVVVHHRKKVRFIHDRKWKKTVAYRLPKKKSKTLIPTQLHNLWKRYWYPHSTFWTHLPQNNRRVVRVRRQL